jgi:dihydrofolate synthase/folylpolyglutamate synthase
MSRAALSLDDWLVKLASFSPHEIELGLERTSTVLERLVLPRPETVLTIAGTNGKGSSVALAGALLRDADELVGAYTSPHVRRYNERIAVDNVPASDDEIIAAFERVDAVRDGLPLTYFEFGTLAALVVFADRGVTRLILEVGMGGRLDAVNAIDPDASLITNISLDHCDWLGDDVETIGREKAGIMRSSRPTVFASHDIPRSVLDTAASVGAELLVAGRDYDWRQGDGNWQWRGGRISLEGLTPPALSGDVQFGNAAGVLALLEAAGFDDCLERDRVNRALGALRVEGRMQRVERERQWLLDVAHNPAAAEALAAALASGGGNRKTIAIVGMRDDKDVEGLVAALAESIDTWIGVPLDDARSHDVRELARRVANASGRACLEAANLHAALAEARAVSSPGDRVVITGSFYLVGPALEALGL